MRIAIYLRVSTEDQDTSLQRQAISAYLEKLPNVTSQTVFEDKSTGKNTNRPGFKAMMAAVQAKQIDRVVCWKGDRLFRRLLDKLIAFKEFAYHNVTFYSVTEPELDYTSPASIWNMQMLGGMAEYESRVNGQRTKAGMEAARARGVRLGAPKKRNDAQIWKLYQDDPTRTHDSIARIIGLDRATITRSLAFSKRKL